MKHAFRQRVDAELGVRNITRAAKDLAYVLSGYPSHSYCWPSHATIASQVKCSVRTVQRALERLRMLGLVDWSHRYRRGQGRGHRTSNVYRLAVPVEAVRALWPAAQILDAEPDDNRADQDASGDEAPVDDGVERVGHVIPLSHTGLLARLVESLGSKRPTRGAGWQPRPEPHPPVRTVEEMLAELQEPYRPDGQYAPPCAPGSPAGCQR